MKTVFLALPLALLVMASPGTSHAEQVTCESINDQETSCRIDTRGDVRMVRQLSKSGCDEGRTWGTRNGSVWVTGGCRAVFESYSDNGYNNNSHSSGNVGSSLPNRVTCESINNGRTDCDMDTRGEVRLTRRMSDASCDEGRSWGITKHTVWVDHGCRAQFESKGSGPVYDNDPAYGGGGEPQNAGGVPSSYVRACNAVEDRYGEVESSSPLKPGHWEVILRYDDGKYVCNAGPNGEVTYFEKLRNQ